MYYYSRGNSSATAARCPWTQRRRVCLQQTWFSDSSSSIWVSASDGIVMSTWGIDSHFNKRCWVKKISLLSLCSARNTCFVRAANTGREPQYYVLKKGSFLLRSECKKYHCSLFATRKNHLFPSENFGKNLGWHPHALWFFLQSFITFWGNIKQKQMLLQVRRDHKLSPVSL